MGMCRTLNLRSCRWLLCFSIETRLHIDVLAKRQLLHKRRVPGTGAIERFYC